MTLDVFTPVAEQPKTAATFGECELFVNDKTDKNGKPYKQVEFNISPVLGSKYMDTLNEKYGKFEWHSKPWDSHVLPSIIQLVNDEKITNAMDLNGAWVAVEWREWLSDRYNDVNYWENRALDEENAENSEGAAKSRSYIIEKDDKKYAKKRYLHFLDVFADEATCQAAYETRYGKIETVDDVPGFEDTASDDKSSEKYKVIASFLPAYITKYLKGDYQDIKTFGNDVIKKEEMFASVFTDENHVIIQGAIKRAKAGKTENQLGEWILEELNLPW